MKLKTLKDFNCFIADDAHLLKVFNSSKQKILCPILQQSKRVILLTGVPLLEKPSELFHLMKILRPDLMPSFPNFAKRYCNPKKMATYSDYSGRDRLQELNIILRQRFLIQRTKSDTIGQLPSQIKQQIIFELPRNFQRDLQRMMKSCMNN